MKIYDCNKDYFVYNLVLTWRSEKKTRDSKSYKIVQCISSLVFLYRKKVEYFLFICF